MTTVRQLVEESVKRCDAPGYQYALFDSETLLSGAAGSAWVPDDDRPAGVPMTEDSILWLASFTKLLVSIVTLRAIDKGLIKGFSFEDLDDSEKLSEIVTELGDPTHNVNKIIGSVSADGDGKPAIVTKLATKRHTLRQLLTHSSGMPYFFLDSNVLGAAASHGWLEPPFPPERTKFFDLPLSSEPGVKWQYGSSADWVGQFVTRGTGRTLRELLHTELLEPLGVTSELDLYFGQESRLVPIYARGTSDNPTLWIADTSHNATGTASFDGEPPAGRAWNATAGAFGSVRAYSKVLQAAATNDERIMSKRAWELATRDSLAEGISIEGWKSAIPTVTNSIESLYPLHDSQTGMGFNLLQAAVARSKLLSGSPAGTYYWCAILNGYWAIDPSHHRGIVLLAQVSPFFDERIVKLRDDIEKLVYRRIGEGASLEAIMG